MDANLRIGRDEDQNLGRSVRSRTSYAQGEQSRVGLTSSSEGERLHTPFFPGTDPASFMRHFQAGHVSSFPSAIPAGVGILPPQAYATLPTLLLAVDRIQGRSLGLHSHGDCYDKQTKAAFARPPPHLCLANKRPAKNCKLSIWIPCKMSPIVSYEGDNCNLRMKKIIQFRTLPVEISLPDDTPWGGIYSREAFVPKSDQWEIARQCSKAFTNNRSNPEWESIAGCFFTKTPKGQHRIESKFKGGASIEPLVYPPSARWNMLPKKSIVYIPNPAVQMTTQKITRYREAAANYETPVGMDSLDVELGLDGVTGNRLQGMENNFAAAAGDISCEGDTDSEEVLAENNERPSYSILTGGQRNVTPTSFDRDLHELDVALGITTAVENPSQEYNVVQRTNRPPQESPLMNPSDVDICCVIQTRSRSHNTIASSSTTNHLALAGDKQCNDSRASLVLNESVVISSEDLSDEDDLNVSPISIRRQLRLSERYLPVQGSYDLEDHSTNKRHADLLENWMVASQEVEALTRKVEEGTLEGNQRLEDNEILVVDLGDLSGQFWECFHAACLEDSEVPEEVLRDLSILSKRRIQQLGLTREMVDLRVPRVLHHVSSLKPYDKNNVEMFFNKAAMPNWRSWEDLMIILGLENVDMDSLEADADFLLKSFDCAPDMLLKEQFNELKLVTLSKELLEWKAFDASLVQSRLCKTEKEYQILKARKKEQHALHQLTVFDISYSKLAEFRKFHEKAPRLSIEVTQGGELNAIREVCQDVLHRKVIFGDFFVNYTTGTSNYKLWESATDAGGLTDRLLTQAWSILFNTSGEFHSTFEKGDTINHLSSTAPNNLHVKSDIILVGQLMFLLILKNQRVTREITMATIAMAMGKEPDRASIRHALENVEKNIYIEDYQQFCPKEYALMRLLLNGGIHAARDALELINNNIADDCLKFGRLRRDLGESRFQSDVMNIVVEIIYSTLFLRCSGVAKYLKEGFFSLVNTIAASPTVSQVDKKEVITRTLAGVEVSAMSAFFSAEQAITGEEFLSRADYEIGFPNDLKSIFVEAVKGFTAPEAYRLYAFITDEKFNRGTRCTIKRNQFLSPDSLPRASTCSKTLELPHYHNVKTMIQKLSLATHSLDYGHA